MYLFAGKRRKSDIASFLHEAEQAGKIRLTLHEFDIERSPDHDLTDQALWDDIFRLLKEGGWCVIVSPPCNTFSRARFRYRKNPGPRPLRSHAWPKGFPWLRKSHMHVVSEANMFVEKCIEACACAFDAGGYFLLEHPEDLGAIDGIRPGSIWQWPEVHDLISHCNATCFAIQQCQFGASTPKPTRFLTTLHVTDSRCHVALPQFDCNGLYKGPLPRRCGHFHPLKLIGKLGGQWRTGPSASYPPQLCSFLAGLILHACASSGGGKRIKQNGPPPGSAKKLCSSSPPEQAKKLCSSSPPEQAEQPASGAGDHGKKVDHQQQAGECDFDHSLCFNGGKPIQVEWDGKTHEFVDGFGLCSPTRWRPAQRGERRAENMRLLAESTFALLRKAVQTHISDVRKAAFKLVTGKLKQSPFSAEVIHALREEWAQLLPDPKDAMVVDPVQPFLLRGLAQWLKIFEDPDAHWLVDAVDSFSSGVCLGVEKPLPRSPQVFPPKIKHRKLDDTEFAPIATNYASAQMSAKELEAKFKEEEGLGRMFPSKLGVLKEQYADRLRVAAMAAIVKPDGTVRPLHDATHSVMVNHMIKYQDKIDCPGPAEIAAIVRESTETGEAPFCVSADIKAAHRLVKVRESDWGYMCCRTDSSSDTVWVNRTGTFGVASAPYWWAKLSGLIGRFVGHVMQQYWFLHMIYVDDLHGSFVGHHKFELLWIWLLAFELVGTPFGYHKFGGGFASDFVGFRIRYDLVEVGVSEKRGKWLVDWIKKCEANRYVVQVRDFS